MSDKTFISKIRQIFKEVKQLKGNFFENIEICGMSIDKIYIL